MARILVADDEPGIREFIVDALSLDGHSVAEAKDGLEAAKLLDAQGFDVLLTDLKMPGLDGLSLLRRVRVEQPEVEVLVLTAHGTVDTAVEAMKAGAFEYLQKPLSGPDELRMVVGRAVERRGLKDREAGVRRAEGQAVFELSYGAPVMRPVLDALTKVARTSATVLLLGESGTGKEVAARALHASSERRERPFGVVNCAALTETLLESELFGHEKGAFTGATERRRGRLEMADGGTFFLDEVGELKPELQAKLLRVIQERRFERVGGTRTLDVDLRWIAATNRDLKAMMEARQFREDLYHRLAVFPIKLPPLRERTEDVVPLAEALLVRICHELKRPKLHLSAQAQKRLGAYRWPGNIRELANCLERAAILTEVEADALDAEQLWLDVEGAASAPLTEVRSLAELEKEAILRALAVVKGNRRLAAERLGIGERTLYDKLKRYGVES